MNSPGKSSHQHDLVLYFQVHQPRRLQAVNFFDIPVQTHYFNDALNKSIVQRIAQQCYLPTNKLLLELIERYPQLRITFSLSGIVTEQLQQYAPEALESFRQLARTQSVEFLGETYYHSLASLMTGDEFEIQVLQHAERMYDLFGSRPAVFRNTELIYNNAIGSRVAQLGFRGIFTEGHRRTLNDRTPHRLYCHPEHQYFKIFLRNHQLSDDIAFRFMQAGVPLKVEQYMSWLHAMPEEENLINLAIDYETFGEHQKAETGITSFLRGLLISLGESERIRMRLPSEVLDDHADTPPLSVDQSVSWGDTERDLSAWLGNEMQRDAFNSLIKLESDVKALGNQELLKYWRYLFSSDHFYYMSVKTDSDGSVHSYFSPFESSYEAFISFMNVVTDLALRIQTEKNASAQRAGDLSGCEAERQEVKANTPVWVMNLESVPQGNIPESHD